MCELWMADDRTKVVSRNLISIAYMEYIQGFQ